MTHPHVSHSVLACVACLHEQAKDVAANKKEIRPSSTLFVVNFDVSRTRSRDIERHFDVYGEWGWLGAQDQLYAFFPCPCCLTWGLQRWSPDAWMVACGCPSSAGVESGIQLGTARCHARVGACGHIRTPQHVLAWVLRLRMLWLLHTTGRIKRVEIKKSYAFVQVGPCSSDPLVHRYKHGTVTVCRQLV